MLEVLDLQFKNSITYGMSYNQFWFDDPQLYYIYQDSYEQRLKDQLKLDDIRNWQLGQYILCAIATCLDTKSRNKYPREPIFFAKAEQKKMNLKDKFLAIVEQINKNFSN